MTRARGLTVIRLKGERSFRFRRGGERNRGACGGRIPFEVVPGVTAPLGIAAYSGFPLTHREHTKVVNLRHGPRR